MKIISSTLRHTDTPVIAIDCYVDKGYVKATHGSLPDCDIDFQSDRRQDIKEYIERRYNHNGKQRVFSAGTFTTLKVKAAIKDIARTMRISPSLANYITAMFKDSECNYTGIFELAAQEKKVAKFIHDYPILFENIRTLLFQPRSSSIHASALLITPDIKDGEDCECFDYVPIKKIDNALVSEDDGYSLDELGLLKNDCLTTNELTKIHQIIDLVNEHYNANLRFEQLIIGEHDDTKVFSLLQNGYTQDVFQLSSKGITKFLISMQPEHIDDLVAAVALYRPATLASGSAEMYVNCKRELVKPEYLWGTYNALKDTFGVMCYQEQLAQISREVGGFSLAEGVKLVKFISKKKQDKIDAMKDKFIAGAREKGCPEEDIKQIWSMFEAAGGYCFNKSHSVAYTTITYVGAWLKANYPTAFYTVALQWAGDDDLVPLMSEMNLCSNARVVEPDINHSTDIFYTDYQSNEIFWSLSRIKMLGSRAVEWIINERAKNGNFTSIVNFIHRIFKYKLKKYEYWDDPDDENEAVKCPVNARHVLNLILAGCFDRVEKIKDNIERYQIITKAAIELGFQIKDKDFPVVLKDKHYFWSQQQIKISGYGSIDYKRIYDNSHIKLQIRGRASYATFSDILLLEREGHKVAICATITAIEEKRFTSKQTGNIETFCKITLQQNNDMQELVIWPEEYYPNQNELLNAKGKVIVCMATVKYSDYTGGNNLQINRSNLIEII